MYRSAIKSGPERVPHPNKRGRLIRKQYLIGKVKEKDCMDEQKKNKKRLKNDYEFQFI